MQFEKRARVAAEKRLNELIAFGRGRGRSLGVGVGMEVGTQTDGDVVGEVLEVEDFWAGDTFRDGETLCDDYLDSAVMLQRAAAATLEIHKMKTYVECDAAGTSGVEMTLLESPRWDHVNCHSHPTPTDR